MAGYYMRLRVGNQVRQISDAPYDMIKDWFFEQLPADGRWYYTGLFQVETFGHQEE